MIPNSLIHYQTSFRVRSSDISEGPLYRIQKAVLNWFQEKEKDLRLYDDGVKPFFGKTELKNLAKTNGSLSTNYVLADKFKGWAVRYTHPDRELKASRFWYIDIGIKEEASEAIFYTSTSFAKNQYDVRSIHPHPPTNTPGFIKRIFADKKCKFYFGAEDFEVTANPELIRVGHGKRLCETILSDKREHTILVFNGDSDCLLAEERDFSDKLIGKCQVFSLEQNEELAEEIIHFLPSELRIPRGYFRLFFPIRNGNHRPRQHRWYEPTHPEYKDDKVGITDSLLRNYPLEEVGAITNISQVGRMITLATLQRNLLSNTANASLLEEFLSEYSRKESELQKTLEDKNSEIKQWVSEYEALDDELKRVKYKLAISQSSPKQDTQTSYSPEEVLSAKVESLSEVILLTGYVFKSRIVFTEEAVSSAKDYRECKAVSKALEIVYHIATTLFDLKFNKSGSIDLAKVFKDKTGFEYAKTEGKASKSDRAIRNSRIVIFEGKEFEIWPHVLWGNTFPNMIRIHFAYDDEKRRIVIGYVGPHMTNATTRTI